MAGPPPNTIGANANILSLASLPTNDEVVYAGTPVGLFKSIDGGGNWSLVGLSGQEIDEISIDQTNPEHIFVISKDSGLESSDGGRNFDKTFARGEKLINTGFPAGIVTLGKQGFLPTDDVNVRYLAVSSTQNLLVISADVCSASQDSKQCKEEIFESVDNGDSWKSLNYSGFEQAYSAPKLVINNSVIYALSDNFSQDGSRSTTIDSYENDKWQNATTVPDAVLSVCISNQLIILGTQNNGLMISNQDATSFSKIDVTNAPLEINSLVSSRGQVVYAGTKSGVYKWDGTTLKRAWSVISSGTSIIESDDGKIYLGTESNGIFVSLDNGKSFSETGYQQAKINGFTKYKDQLYAASDNGFLRFNNGKWELGGIQEPVLSVAVDPKDGTIFAAETVSANTPVRGDEDSSWISYSKDGGGTFTKIQNPQATHPIFIRVIIDSENDSQFLYALTTSQSYYKINLKNVEDSSSWELLQSPDYFSDIAKLPDGTLLGGVSMIKSSDDNSNKTPNNTTGIFYLKDNNWNPIDFQKGVTKILIVGDASDYKVYIGTSSEGLYVCTNVIEKISCNQVEGTANLGVKDIYYFLQNKPQANNILEPFIKSAFAQDNLGGAKLLIATNLGAKVISLGGSLPEKAKVFPAVVSSSSSNLSLYVISALLLMFLIIGIVIVYLFYFFRKKRLSIENTQIPPDQISSL